MGITISQLVAATGFNETDVFEIEQNGVSRKLTKQQLRSLLFSDPAFVNPPTVPQNGDSIYYSNGDFLVGAPSRWRTISQEAYTESSPGLGVSIVFSGGASGLGIPRRATYYFVKGVPVRVNIGGTMYYGMAGDVIEFGLTFVGPLLPTAPIISLEVGTPDMMKFVDLVFPDVGYNSSTTLVLAKGCQHLWRGKTGHLVAYSCSHCNTSATTIVQLQMAGGANVSLTGVAPAAGTATTRGAFVTSALGSLIPGTLDINDGELITVKTPTAIGSADYLIVNMAFVVE